MGAQFEPLLNDYKQDAIIMEMLGYNYHVIDA